MAERQYGISEWGSNIQKSAQSAVQRRVDKKAARTRAGQQANANIAAFFASKPAPGSQTKKRGKMSALDASELRRFKNKAAADRRGRGNAAPTVEEESSILDGLMLGGSGGGGGGGAAYSARDIAAAQAAMGTNRARMEALYRRYAEDIAAQEANIIQTYDRAGTSLGGIYDTSAGNINKAYDAARAAQTQQLLALGMTEQTPVQSFGNQTAATTSLNNLRAAVLAQNEASRKAAITNQRLASEAASREGTQALARFDSEAAQALAEMQAARTSGGGGGGGGGGLSPYQYASLALKEQEMKFNQQRAAAEFAAKTAPKATVDRQAILNQVAKSGAGLTPEQYNMFRALAG